MIDDFTCYNKQIYFKTNRNFKSINSIPSVVELSDSGLFRWLKFTFKKNFAQLYNIGEMIIRAGEDAVQIGASHLQYMLASE